MKTAGSTTRPTAPPSAGTVFVAEVADGLEDIARDEIARVMGGDARITAAGEIRYTLAGDPRRAFALRAVQAIYASVLFAVPRPKALLGDAHFRSLARAVEDARALWPDGAFRSVRLAAAGAESAVMTRLRDTLAVRFNLSVEGAEGDLLIRLRPVATGWEALIRLSPRPLATRAWRVRNFPGALNAAVASAMAMMLRPRADDVFVNLFCGSGTLLIERLAQGPAARAIGIDADGPTLGLAQANLNAARLGGGRKVELIQADARRLPLPKGCATTLCADLPFGQLVGTHAENALLYPAALAEASRIAAKGARMCLITHEARLMATTLRDIRAWKIVDERRIGLNGLHPRIYLLHRTA